MATNIKQNLERITNDLDVISNRVREEAAKRGITDSGQAMVRQWAANGKNKNK